MKTRLEILNKVANGELTPIEAENQLLVLSDVIPRYKFGTYHRDNETPEYDWFIIDTETDKIVEKLKDVSLSDARLRCREWNNNVV